MSHHRDVTVTESSQGGDGSDSTLIIVLYVTTGLVALMAIVTIIICLWVRSKYSGQSL